MTDTRVATPANPIEPGERRYPLLLALNVALLAVAIVVFFVQDSGLARWLLLVTCALNTFNSWHSWRGR